MALGLVRSLARAMGDATQLLEALGGVAARLPAPEPNPNPNPDPGPVPGGGARADADGQLATAALDCLLAAAGAPAAMPAEARTVEALCLPVASNM